MAITWGAKKSSSSGNYMRLGYELTQSPSSVGTGTSSVVVTLKVYVNTRYPVSDSSNSFSITGSFSHSGAETINHGGNGEVTLLQTETRTVTTSYTSTTNSSFTASLSGINAIPGTASVSGNITTGKRPISAPDAPSNINVSRNSDTSHTISWTNVNSGTASKPYQNIEVQRWSKATGYYATVATLGVVSSYTNTSTNANNQFRWRVRSKNSAGASSYIYSGYWSTTPAAPSTPKATKVANDVNLTWTNNNLVDSGGVEVWHAANGVWDGAKLATLAGNPSPSSYTHLNPNAAQTHQYRLKAYAGATDDAPTTFSAYTASSNVIQLLTNPAAPTQLSPSSGVRDAATQAIVLSWQHNEVDGTGQTKYDLQYRMNGGAWTMVTATTTTQSRTFAAGTLANGAVMDWQVRTYGQYATAPAYSPWSAMATLTLSAAPQAGVIFPDDVIPVDTSRITAQWSYTDEEGTAQAQWKVRLYTAGGGALLETKTGVGTATTVPLTTLLADGASYRLGVEVQDGTGLWSPQTTQDFTVAYTLPDVPTLGLLWDPNLSAVVVSVQNPTGGTGEVVDHNEVWRSVDWQTYELVADNVPPNGTVTDYIPATGTENVYKAVAVTALEAAAESEPLVFETPDLPGWFLINGGTAFATRVGVRYNPDLARDFSRDKALNKYAGRTFPVETVGEQRNRVYDLSVAVLGDDDATLKELESIADIPGPLVLRTPDHERMYVSLAGISSTHVSVFENVSMKLTQVDPPNTGTMAFDPVVYRTNWSSNPSFEVDTTGVITASSVAVAISTEDFYVGTNALKATVTVAGTATYVGFTETIPEGMTYMKAAVRVRYLSGDQYFKIRIGYRDHPTTGTITYITPTAGVTATDWTTINIETAIPATSQYVNVLVYVTDTPAVSDITAVQNSVFFVDGVHIDLGTSAADTDVSEYFDGDTWEGDTILDAGWVGTPHNSRSQLTRGGTT